MPHGTSQTRFNFQWDPERFTDPAASLAAIRAHQLRVCVWEYPYVSIHDKLFQQLAQRGYLLKTPEGDPYVFVWDTSPGPSPFGNVLTPLPGKRHRRLHATPKPMRGGATRTGALFADGVDVIMSDYGEQVPDDAVAYNGDRGRRLHNVYPLLYNQCVFEATQEIPAEGFGRRWSGAAPDGPAASAIRWAGAASRKATGKGLPRRCAADCRGA